MFIYTLKLTAEKYIYKFLISVFTSCLATGNLCIFSASKLLSAPLFRSRGVTSPEAMQLVALLRSRDTMSLQCWGAETRCPCPGQQPVQGSHLGELHKEIAGAWVPRATHICHVKKWQENIRTEIWRVRDKLTPSNIKTGKTNLCTNN